MNEEQFDHITKMKLQDYSAAIPAGLWEKIHVPSINPSNINTPAEHFDQFVQQKLVDHEATVSPEIWNKIKPKEDEDRKVFFLLPRAGMVAASILLLILAGSVSAYLYYQKIATENSSSNQSDNVNHQRSQNNNNQSSNNQENKIQNNISNSPKIIGIDASKDEKIVEPSSRLNEPISELDKSAGDKTRFSKSDLSNSIGMNKNISSVSKGIDESQAATTFESEYTAFNKMDATLISFSKNKLNFNSKEKQVSAFNHTNNIKNVVICPSDRKMRNTDWDLEIYASPDYAFKTVSSITASRAYMDRKDSSEKSQVSFTAGFRIVKPINDHFSIKTGLQYSQINEHFNYRSENEIKTTTVVTVRTITLINGNTVIVSDTSVVQQIGFKNNTVKNRYSSFDIPALLSYQFGNDDLKIGLNAGVIFNISSWYQGVVLDTSLIAKPLTKETNISYKNNIGMGIYTGISITKRLNYNTSIFAEPYFRYNLSDMTTPQSSFTQRFSIGGLSIGLRMNLNKN